MVRINKHLLFLQIILIYFAGVQDVFSQSSILINARSEHPTLLRFIYKLPTDSVWNGQQFFDFHLENLHYTTYQLIVPDSITELRAFFVCSAENNIGIKQITIINGLDSLEFSPDIIRGDWRWANFITIDHTSNEFLVKTKISYRGENPTAFFIVNNSQKELMKLNFSRSFFSGKLTIQYKSNGNTRILVRYGRDKAWISDQSGISIWGSDSVSTVNIDLNTPQPIKYFEIRIVPRENSEIELHSISYFDGNLDLYWPQKKISRKFKMIDMNRGEIDNRFNSVSTIKSSTVLSLKQNLVDPMIKIRLSVAICLAVLGLFMINKFMLFQVHLHKSTSIMN